MLELSKNYVISNEPRDIELWGDEKTYATCLVPLPPRQGFQRYQKIFSKKIVQLNNCIYICNQTVANYHET